MACLPGQPGSRKVTPIWIITKREMMEWQRHQLGHTQKIICTSLQTDNHDSALSLIFTGRMPFLTPNQQCWSTEGNIIIIENNRKKEFTSHITYIIKPKWNQFLLVVKAATIKQQISKFYPQILSTGASNHIYVSYWPVINVKASVCA